MNTKDYSFHSNSIFVGIEAIGIDRGIPTVFIADSYINQETLNTKIPYLIIPPDQIIQRIYFGAGSTLRFPIMIESCPGVLNRFIAEHPDIKVVLETTPEYIRSNSWALAIPKLSVILRIDMNISHGIGSKIEGLKLENARQQCSISYKVNNMDVTPYKDINYYKDKEIE